jgi:hypothetical protein
MPVTAEKARLALTAGKPEINKEGYDGETA